MVLKKNRIVIARDVDEGNGTGVQIYSNNEMFFKIFQAYVEKSSIITVFKKCAFDTRIIQFFRGSRYRFWVLNTISGCTFASLV